MMMFEVFMTVVLLLLQFNTAFRYNFVQKKVSSQSSLPAILRPQRAAPSEPENQALIDEMIAEKLKQWKVMKEEGLLQQLTTSTLDDETLAGFDAKANKLLQSKGVAALRVVEDDESRPVANPRVLKELEAKIVAAQKDEVNLYNILLEIRDKGIAEECEELVMQIFEYLPKLAGKKIEAALKLCITWHETCLLELEAEFWEAWIRKVATSQRLEKRQVLEKLLLDAELVREEELWIAELLSDIRFQQNNPQLLTTKLQELLSKLEGYTLDGVNDVVKALGLAGYQRDCFTIVERMRNSRSLQSRPDIVSFEFLVNSIIFPVVKEETAKNMKDLPAVNMSVPEIILLGRSNVGKSSLTNLLLNRKNLASVSATPGHTQAFHFFSLQRRASLSKCLLPASTTQPGVELVNIPGSKQAFRIVDIPGLGYAETVDEDRQQSWRSLIMRYLAVRESCHMVLHLVDSRHSLSEVDKDIIAMVKEAQQERAKTNKRPFQFTTVLTKADKMKSKAQVDRAVDGKIQEIKPVLGDQPVSIVATSATEKIGLEQLWLHMLDGLFSA